MRSLVTDRAWRAKLPFFTSEFMQETTARCSEQDAYCGETGTVAAGQERSLADAENCEVALAAHASTTHAHLSSGSGVSNSRDIKIRNEQSILVWIEMRCESPLSFWRPAH